MRFTFDQFNAGVNKETVALLFPQPSDQCLLLSQYLWQVRPADAGADMRKKEFTRYAPGIDTGSPDRSALHDCNAGSPLVDRGGSC